MLEIHNSIHEKLNYFINIKKIPNLLFYGPHGSGKKEILFSFLKKIYGSLNNEKYILIENCGHNTGIKFIREQLKFFSKSNINSKDGHVFKSIILLNADKLTSDAQSALRRCIEIYSHNTRFFVVVENKSKLLNPIISRFCEIFINYPTLNNKKINLHIHKNERTISLSNVKKQENYLQKTLFLIKEENKNIAFIETLASKLYNKGYSIFDIMKAIENNKKIDSLKKYKILFYFDKIRYEFRNEKLIILQILYFLYLRPNEDLENVSIM